MFTALGLFCPRRYYLKSLYNDIYLESSKQYPFIDRVNFPNCISILDVKHIKIIKSLTSAEIQLQIFSLIFWGYWCDNRWERMSQLFFNTIFYKTIKFNDLNLLGNCHISVSTNETNNTYVLLCIESFVLCGSKSL